MSDKKMIHREPTTEVGVAELRAKLYAGAKAEEAKLAGLQLDREDIRAQVAAGVVDGLALIIHDEALVKKFSRKIYEQAKEYFDNDMNTWFGKRLFVLAVGMIVMWGIAVLIRNGTIK